MKIMMERSELLAALTEVCGVVERRQTLPVLGNVLVSADQEEITLRASDLEVEVATRARAGVEEEGATTVPAKKMLEIVRSLPEGARVAFRLEGERAIVASGRSRFVLSTLAAKGFPSMEAGKEEVGLTMSQGTLKRLLDKTAFAMAQQDVRYYLNGVLLEVGGGQVVAVATDGHRLAKVAGMVEEVSANGMSGAMQVIVPAKSVMELKRLLTMDGGSVRLELSERTMRAELGGTTLMSKLVDGRYPEYERVIPKRLEHCAVVEREALKAALQRTAILSNEKYKGVRVTVAKGALGLQSQNPEQEEAEDSIEVGYEGEAVVLGFNIEYILDVLGTIGERRVELHFRDGDSSAVWKGEDALDEVFVIMPMRL